MDSNTTISTDRYREILVANGIMDKIKQITVQDSGAKGDGFASLTQCVTVEFEKEANRKPLQLFVKIHTDNPSHEQFLNDLQAFEKESQFFMEYLPEAEKLVQRHGLDSLMDIYPKCYYGDKSIIVLENLVLEKSYEMHSRDKRQDFETARLVMNSLAKHHAISYAMVAECGGGRQFCERFSTFEYDAWMSEMFLKMIEEFFENSLKTNIAILEQNMKDSADLVKKLKQFQGKPRDMCIESLKQHENDTFRVLVHGDFKSNNMMFRKNKNANGSLEAKIIDFQIISYNAASLDIALYMYSSVEPKVRQSRLQELLHNYLAAFNKICDDLGHPANMSFEELMLQYKRKVSVGFLNGMCLVGPGMALWKTTDESDVTKINMDDMSEIFHKNLLKWVAEHPEKGKEMAEEVAGLVEEYETLTRK